MYQQKKYQPKSQKISQILLLYVLLSHKGRVPNVGHQSPKIDTIYYFILKEECSNVGQENPKIPKGTLWVILSQSPNKPNNQTHDYNLFG